jgi:histone-binding protein RBBP4
MLLGTHTSGKGTDQLMIAEVMLPKTATETAGKDITELYDEERQGESTLPIIQCCCVGIVSWQPELGSYTNSKPRIKVVHTINHDGEINRARYMPQNTDLLATKAINGDVNIFDRTKHPSKAPAGGECRPDIVLKGLKTEGWVKYLSMSRRWGAELMDQLWIELVACQEGTYR